ncbi:MAG: MTH1187 family thiamine-binding protein [Sphingobacteriia bacterium]|nr:MTH1187 family thiamine-binding protein [Sphingobacteriia bacterium]NCC38209.1 MTH1187 family thiamine-binding protein [Gammaproteobacteria bacterium]
MSVLLDLSVFPTDQGASLSRFVAPVIAMIRDSGHPYRLAPMGTVVETETLPEALDLIRRAHELLDGQGCERVYATAKLDIRRGATGRLTGKIAAVERLVGEVAQ